MKGIFCSFLSSGVGRLKCIVDYQKGSGKIMELLEIEAKGVSCMNYDGMIFGNAMSLNLLHQLKGIMRNII